MLLDLFEGWKVGYGGGFKKIEIGFKVKYAAISSHTKEDHIGVYNSISLRSKFYAYWIENRIIERDIEKYRADSSENYKFYSVRVPSLDLFVYLSSGFGLSINVLSAKIKKRGRIGFSFSKEKSLRDLIDVVEKFNELLYLLTGYRVHPKYTISNDEQPFGEARLLTWTGKERMSVKEYNYFRGIRFSEIEQILPEILENWYSKYDKLKHLNELQSSIIWRESVPIREAFLVLCQLIEGWIDTQGLMLHMKESEYKKSRKSAEKFIDSLDLDENVKKI